VAQVAVAIANTDIVVMRVFISLLLKTLDGKDLEGIGGLIKGLS
jgi:hypothetical protein